MSTEGGGTPYSIQPADVVDIAIKEFEHFIENRTRAENLNIDLDTKEESKKIVKDALHSKMGEIRATIQSQPVNVDQIRRAAEKLAISAIDRAEKESRKSITSGDVVLAFMDLGVKGCIWPICSAGSNITTTGP